MELPRRSSEIDRDCSWMLRFRCYGDWVFWLKTNHYGVGNRRWLGAMARQSPPLVFVGLRVQSAGPLWLWDWARRFCPFLNWTLISQAEGGKTQSAGRPTLQWTVRPSSVNVAQE